MKLKKVINVSPEEDIDDKRLKINAEKTSTRTVTKLLLLVFVFVWTNESSFFILKT